VSETKAQVFEALLETVADSAVSRWEAVGWVIFDAEKVAKGRKLIRRRARKPWLDRWEAAPEEKCPIVRLSVISDTSGYDESPVTDPEPAYFTFWGQRQVRFKVRAYNQEQALAAARRYAAQHGYAPVEDWTAVPPLPQDKEAE